jgi:hypothetical protein
MHTPTLKAHRFEEPETFDGFPFVHTVHKVKEHIVGDLNGGWYRLAAWRRVALVKLVDRLVREREAKCLWQEGVFRLGEALEGCDYQPLQ